MKTSSRLLLAGAVGMVAAWPLSHGFNTLAARNKTPAEALLQDVEMTQFLAFRLDSYDDLVKPIYDEASTKLSQRLKDKYEVIDRVRAVVYGHPGSPEHAAMIVNDALGDAVPLIGKRDIRVHPGAVAAILGDAALPIAFAADLRLAAAKWDKTLQMAQVFASYDTPIVHAVTGLGIGGPRASVAVPGIPSPDTTTARLASEMAEFYSLMQSAEFAPALRPAAAAAGKLVAARYLRLTGHAIDDAPGRGAAADAASDRLKVVASGRVRGVFDRPSVPATAFRDVVKSYGIELPQQAQNATCLTAHPRGEASTPVTAAPHVVTVPGVRLSVAYDAAGKPFTQLCTVPALN